MSGHSKWASIKHKKGALDAQKGKLFSKLTKEIAIAAKGGGDPKSNARLRKVIEKARESNLPNDKIQNAIKKGTGELPGQVIEEVTYEGYGPGGVAILVEAATDNKNRTSSDVRNLFAKRGGNMAGAGSVHWIFQKKGFLTVAKSAADEDRVMTVALESGAEDFTTGSDTYEITTGPADLDKVKAALQAVGIVAATAELTMLPTTTVRSEGENAKNILALIESLEEHEDVQNVYANFDIPDEILQALGQS